MSHSASEGSPTTGTTRAIEPSPLFWIAMLAASALGTNLGDFWAEDMSLGLVGSFALLAALSALLIWADRRYGRRGEAFFWIAIIILRAAATNVGDFLTDNLGVSYILATLILAAATLAAGWFTVSGGIRNASPRIDLRYWIAMIIGGVFGTIGGDLVSHTIGLPLAALALAAILIATIAARSFAAPVAMLGYWCIVLAERAAGTAAGDLFAERRGLGFGLPIAMAITGATLAAALSLRAANWKIPMLAGTRALVSGRSRSSAGVAR